MGVMKLFRVPSLYMAAPRQVRPLSRKRSRCWPWSERSAAWWPVPALIHNDYTDGAGTLTLPSGTSRETFWYQRVPRRSFAFIVNGDDNCTALSLAGDVVLQNPQTAGGAPQAGNASMTVGGGSSAVTSGDPTLAGGVTALAFSAPGSTNTGYVNITLDLVGAAQDWLLYDWDGGGPLDDNPAGRATFGIYNGQQNHIYLRETW